MSSFLNRIQCLVRKSENAQDLVNVINHIPIQSLKEFINGKLQLMNENKLREIYYDSSSINNIISDDVIQSMISYIPYEKSIKYINKAFNKFVKLNNDLMLRLRERNILSQFKNTNIWIVDSSRNYLNSEEIKKGIKGPCKSLHEALNKMESGDKILLSKGKYTMENSFDFYEKNIQIEGIGKECTILNSLSEEYDFSCANQQLSMSNLSLCKNGIDINGGNIWLTNCIVEKSWIGIADNAEATKLDCMRCKFIGDGKNGNEDRTVCYVWKSSGESTLFITDCVFDNCGGGDGHAAVIQCNDEKSIRLKIIGNVFKNLGKSTSPIGGYQAGDKLTVKDHWILGDNSIDKFDNEIPDILYYFLNK